MPRLKKQLLIFWTKYERPINLASLIGGFVFDLFLAKRPDSIVDNVLLVFYLCLSASIVISLNLRATRREMASEAMGHPRWRILILQFCFGGLASNLLILYGKSGTLGGSVLFVLILGAFALGNEFLKTRYDQLRFNVAIYYFLLLTYCIISIPTFIIHTIGTWVFLLSGAVSLGIIAFFITMLHLYVFRKKERGKIYEVSVIVLVIFFLFNGLYFLNIIPPVPLSLKSVGIYHSLVPLGSPDAAGNIYSATYEKPQWYVFWRDTSSNYTVNAQNSPDSGNAYCYSAVFAPGNLSTPIVHRWEKYNDQTKSWETQSLDSFAINGGRAEGYRGWSTSLVSAGQWRCDIETGRGSLIGRISFTVVQGSTTLSTTQM